MSFQIRPYREEDSQSILEIINDSILNTSFNYDYYPKSLEEIKEMFLEKVRDGIPVLVCELENRVCGYATFGKFRTKPGYSRTIEHSIYFREGTQGKGMGTAMLKQLIELAKTQGYHVMIAGMDSENHGSYRFHERLGFREAGRFPEVAFKFGKWLSLVFMQLNLNQHPGQV
ncbi:N-acetyltransferase family protein [Algoriphagus confluentis]|uniref:GNAT family N-acetyltransferase n=1 Tax=Algoriphagus confluentis TaxID=1697556 RepID=A0ABQ6PVN2_9BACT|nr:GNAT family N-acetyltransferase [Algoriphagus confluentis]